MKHMIQECNLEYQLTYSGERLCGVSVLEATIKSIKRTIKCFRYLIKPHHEKDIF